MTDDGSAYASYDPGMSSGDGPPMSPADGGDQSSMDGPPPPPAASPPAQSSVDDSSSQSSSESSSDGGDGGEVCSDPDQESPPADGDDGALMTPASGASTESSQASSASSSTEDIPVWPHAVLELSPEEVVPGEEPEPEEEEESANAFQISKSGEIGEPLDWPVKYGHVKGELEWKVDGTVTPEEATSTQGWDDGIYKSFAKEFKWGDWKTEFEIKFGKPVEKKKEGEEEKKFLVEVEASGSGSREWSAGEVGGVEVVGEAEIEIAATAIKIGKPKEGDDAKWEVETGELKASVTGSTSGKYKLTEWGYKGTLDGTVGVEASLTFEPDWNDVIEDLIKSWGEELTCEVAVDLVLAFSVVAGGVAAIVVNTAIIFEAFALEEMRDSTVPSLTNSATQGFMDGVSGTSQGTPGAQITDPDGANGAGAAAGAKKRSEIVSQKCGGDASRFDKWLADGSNKQDVEKAAREEIQASIEEALWVSKAKEYASSWKRSLPGGDAMTCHDQYLAWAYIIGNSPVSRGGKWVQTWLKNRVEDTDEPDRSAGNW